MRGYNSRVDKGAIAVSKTIGILGGMGALATVDLFHKIVNMTYSDSDSGHLHIIVDNNTLIPDRTKAILHNGPSPLPEMIRSAISLERSGADILIMGCNTAHYYYRDICRFVKVPFLNMIKETAAEARRRSFCRVGLLATDGTIASGVYKNEFLKEHIDLLTPEAGYQGTVMDIIYRGVKAGRSDWDTAPLADTLRNLEKRGAQAVILGCTELPLAFSIYHINSRIPLIDPTAVLARQAILAAGGRVREAVSCV